MNAPRMRVLLIDDHALVRKGIEELLQSRGVQVVAAVGSGEEGVRRARELPRRPHPARYQDAGHDRHRDTEAHARKRRRARRW